MVRFWKRLSRPRGLEGELRTSRPEPRPEFLRAMTDRMQGGGARRRMAAVRTGASAATAALLLVSIAVFAGAGFRGAVSDAMQSIGLTSHKGHPGSDHRVTICHATGSESNPFVKITPASAGVFNGHLGGDHQNGEDIIPPFQFEGQTYSQNWPEGQEIFEDDCEVSPQYNGPRDQGL